eukprot:GHRQ01010026.1.p1 GENE.GHRQ01010026.1~~GHRQ01010026.1.p1  ORF type:complete len:212 (-),score=41.86 GHRQ01010026.1:383-1018(-)
MPEGSSAVLAIASQFFHALTLTCSLLQVFELDFSDLFGAPNPAAWSAVLAYTLVMVFDIGGAMFGLGSLAGRCAFCSRTRRSSIGGQQLMWSLLQHLSAALGTALGAVTGTTPLIIAAESAVGIKEGGRTGLVAVTVSGCFLCSMFLAPLLQVWLLCLQQIGLLGRWGRVLLVLRFRARRSYAVFGCFVVQHALVSAFCWCVDWLQDFRSP